MRIGRNGRPQVSRISISLPRELLADLDGMVGKRGFARRLSTTWCIEG